MVANMEVAKVADMEVNMVADMEVVMVANMEVAKVADMEVVMVANMDVEKVAYMEVNMVATITKEVAPSPSFFSQFFFKPKLLRAQTFFKQKLTSACAFSKLCEFIHSIGFQRSPFFEGFALPPQFSSIQIQDIFSLFPVICHFQNSHLFTFSVARERTPFQIIIYYAMKY